jgi:hypothetical protein
VSRHHASASRAELLLACGWWAHPARELGDTGSRAASDGTDNHSHLAAACRGEPAPEWAQAAALDVPPDALVEVPVALSLVSPYSGRRLPVGPARDYSAATDAELPGTLDVAWVEDDHTLVIRDWKTGDNARDNTTPAEDNAQLAALALALLLGGLGGGIGVSSVRLQLAFVGPSRELEVDEHHTTARGIEARWLVELSGALDRVFADERLAPRPNRGCHWCPALATCPAQARGLATIDAEAALDAPELFTTEIRGPEHAAQLHAALAAVTKRFEARHDELRAALKEWVRAAGPVPYGPGKVLRVSESTRETVALSRCTPELRAELERAGAVSVSMSSSLRVGSVAGKGRKKKTGDD